MTPRAASRILSGGLWALLVCGGWGLPARGDEAFTALVQEKQAAKPTFAKRHQQLLAERYDLADRPATGVVMTRGKPVQAGVRVRLPQGATWDKLAALTPEQIKSQNLWPAGFYPLPHPHHEEGEWYFRNRRSTRSSGRTPAT